jgi:hypothetical protein
MAIAVSMVASEKRWREESDVRTLAEAEKIKSDRKRVGAAKKRAKVMAADAQREANAVKKVATGRLTTTTTKKTTRKRGTTRKRTVRKK